MSGSNFGKVLQLTTFGESHGVGLGAVLDGFPAGMALSEADIQVYLDRRRPGSTTMGTTRQEADRVELLSGVFEGRTTGTPIAMLVRNTAQRSGDYNTISQLYRPGHADYGFDARFGLRDWRGGGRSSGRETIGRVAAGAVCAKLLGEMGIELTAYTCAIGDIRVDPVRFDREFLQHSATAMPDPIADEQAVALVQKLREQGDSIGSAVACRITGVPAGLGDPVFDKLDARFAQALMSIGAVKSVSVGDGAAVTTARGSENNDAFLPAAENAGSLRKATNHSGGILGGISDGSDILLQACFKPTPSISLPQQTVNRDGIPADIEIHGRHDPVIAPRAAVVVETMCAIVLLDAMLSRMCTRADDVISFYGRR